MKSIHEVHITNTTRIWTQSHQISPNCGASISARPPLYLCRVCVLANVPSTQTSRLDLLGSFCHFVSTPAWAVGIVLHDDCDGLAIGSHAVDRLELKTGLVTREERGYGNYKCQTEKDHIETAVSLLSTAPHRIFSKMIHFWCR